VNIVVVGQGAIGLLWYHQLSKNSNNRVSLLCSTRITSLPPEILFTDIENRTTTIPLTLANDAALNTADVILFCVKSYQISAALASIINHANAKATLIFCHNGMGAVNHLATLSQPCYALLTTHGSKIITPFHAQHTGLGHNDLGLINSSLNTEVELKEQIVNTLAIALPSLTLSDNIKAKQWLKLAVNCVINPITAIDNVNNGQLLSEKYTTLIEQLLKEVIAVAACEDIRFDFNELKAKVLLVARKTAENCSSMRSDVLHQRPTEIDYINGYIVKLAKNNKISVPKNEKMVRQVRKMTN
jgi:2-dehydropantoate 2-reductase